MVTLQVIERCTPSGESPEFIDNTFVPGVDIFVIAVVKLERSPRTKTLSAPLHTSLMNL